MRADVDGTRRIRALIGSGPGIHIKQKGERKRRSIRGKQIADDIAQINLRVEKEGHKPIGVVLGKETVEAKESAKKEQGTSATAKT
jgi:small subunit ribosomal protein S6e